jgi:FeS assembly SUF system protein
MSALPKIRPDDYNPANATEEKIIAALRQVYDPEIPLNIYDLGLIYKIEVGEGGVVDIEMTLTAPGCPVAGEMPGMVASAAETVDEVKEARVNLVWEPAWDKDRMSEDAKLALGFF